jgi:hypothetical protein
VPSTGRALNSWFSVSLPWKMSPAHEAELALEVGGAKHARPRTTREVGRKRVTWSTTASAARSRSPPSGALGQRVAEVLAEKARHVRARGREAVVHGARDEHLDDRLRGPARARARCVRRGP